jgi:chemotaxis family two-component system sensor kinase Cph1
MMIRDYTTLFSRLGRSAPELRKIRTYAWVMAAVWTAILAGSFTWYYDDQHTETETIARAEARAAFGRDTLYRRWAAAHGGVYVPVTEKTVPNPYLKDIPERDVTTPSGRRLTLVNPAYMARQVYELAGGEESLGRGHITSLKPLRPENAPDPWETRALLSFERGVKEVMEVQVLDGKPHMRLMRPFVAEAACLKCHAVQGYREGEVRGGVSVSIPMQSFIDAAQEQILGNAIAHGVIWVMGIGMIGFGSRSLYRGTRTLRESEHRYQTVADFTSDWEYWISPEDTFIYMSPSCRDICGHSAEDFRSDPQLMRRIIHPDDRSLYDDHLHHLNAEGVPRPIDFRIIAKDGRTRWISHVCRTIFDEFGVSLGQRASNRDITERKQAEEALQRQAVMLAAEIAERTRAQEELFSKQQQLETLNRSLEDRISATVSELRQRDQILIQQGRLAAMGEMINNIAHQWRQPLNNIGLIVQNLQMSCEAGTLTPDEMDREVDRAMEVIMHMSHTIDDFRNFFRPEKEKHLFTVNKAVAHALDMISATLVNSDIRVELVEEGTFTVMGHQNEYAQVVLNILNNARDALVEGNVSRAIVRIVIGGRDGCSFVTVRDNAGGIAEDALPKIFDPYFTTKGPGKGTGIGLYMSKAIIEQNMGGRITAGNVEGGAEFRIEV